MAYLASLGQQEPGHGRPTPTLPAMHARPPRGRQGFRVTTPHSQSVEDQRPGAPRLPVKPPTRPEKRTAASEMEDLKADMDIDKVVDHYRRFGPPGNWPSKVPGAVPPQPRDRLLPAALTEATRAGIAHLRLTALRREVGVGDGFDEQDQLALPADAADWPHTRKPHRAHGT